MKGGRAMKLVHATVKSDYRINAEEWLGSINQAHIIAVVPRKDGAFIRITASECLVDGYEVRESAVNIEQLAKC